MTSVIKTIGVVGAGTMGLGIAQVCATRGFNVQLYDVRSEVVIAGIAKIALTLDTLVGKNKITPDEKAQSLNRIRPIQNLSDFKCEMIIEAAIERLDVKRQLFADLENVLPASALLTSNTSSIPITQIASVLKSPWRFAGLHFFNPAPVMKLVEIIRGAATNDNTINSLKGFCNQLQKEPVLAYDSPGFIVNRVARHFYVESLKLVEENVSSLQDIDRLMRSSGFKMGPFELMDLIGIDVNFAVTSSLYSSFHNDPKFRPSRIQQQKVDAGHHGRKSGKGFYDYTK